MARFSFFAIYFWIKFAILSYWLVSAKPFTRRSSDEPGTDVDYDLQKQLADDTLLTTGVEHNKDLFDEITDHSKMIDMEKYRQKYLSSSSMKPERQKTEDYSKHKAEKFQHKGNWRGKNKKIHDSYKKVDRESRDEDNEDDLDYVDHVQSKDEEEDDEDVQLIIIPKKPRKHFRTKVREDENDDEARSKETEEVDENSENKYSEKSGHESENSSHQTRGHKTSEDGDVSIETSDVRKEKDGRGSEENRNYDLKIKVKDKSGTKVKLTGDLPGNIGNLMGEGKGGGKVQIKNTNNKEGGKITTEDENNDDDTASTDDVAQTLIKMKSGKLKHAPYPSTVLLKPPQSQEQSEVTINAGEETATSDSERTDENQEMSLLKSKGSDGDSSEEISKTVLKSPSHDQVVADEKEQTDKQTNNIFSPMDFKNGDDEIVATSRLLDIARKVDDEPSLKEEKDSSNSKSSSSDNNLTGQQRSMTISKLPKLDSENYKKQSDELDEESCENWYRLQSLQDQIVNEGSTAKPGKTMGSYNGQEVSVASPSQLQLLQTEYPSYPAYLTALQREKVNND